jgi:Flp pilus assembly protein TadD
MLAQKHLMKAKMAERRGQDARALRLYKRAMYTERHTVKKFRAAMSLGKLATQLGRSSDARRGFQRAVSLRPRDAKANIGLGITLLDTNPKAALARLATAANLKVKRKGDVLAAIAQGQALTGLVKRARTTLAKAIKAGASGERIKAARVVLPGSGVIVAIRK